MTRLAGKVAIVTGGAQGMGASHCRAVVAHGGALVVADVQDGVGSRLAADLGPAAHYVHLDVTDEAGWTDAIAETLRHFGKLNVLVHNAGIVQHARLGKYTRADWDRMLAVNTTGPFIGTTIALQALTDAAPSSVINIASGARFRGQAGMHGYTASKWALRGFTRSAALELGGRGTRVNSICPGVIATPMTAEGDFSSHFGPLVERAIHLKSLIWSSTLRATIRHIPLARTSSLTGATSLVRCWYEREPCEQARSRNVIPAGPHHRGSGRSVEDRVYRDIQNRPSDRLRWNDRSRNGRADRRCGKRGSTRLSDSTHATHP